MNYLSVRNASTQRTLGARILPADSFLRRLRGLIARPRLQSGEGLLLSPCQGVHMRFMSQPLDVAVLDAEGRVLALYPGMMPGEKTRWYARARYVLELPPGMIEGTDTQLGDEIVWAIERSPMRRAAPTGKNGRASSDNRNPQGHIQQ